MSNVPGPDNEGNFPPPPSLSLNYRAPLHRSVSQTSQWSPDTRHHHEGTSYFPPASPTPRRAPNRSISAARSLAMSSDDVAEQDEGSDALDRGKGTSSSEDPASSPEVQDNEEDDADTEVRFAEDDLLTVKDRQSMMNVDHPFGLPIWKPALYKKSRSVNRNAEIALHATPSSPEERHLHAGNILWVILFGWWLGLACYVVSALLFLIPLGGRRHSALVFGLGWYLAWPFGKYVEGVLSAHEIERQRKDTGSQGVETQEIRRIEEEEEDGQATPRLRSPQSTITPRSLLARHGQTDSNVSDNVNERTTLMPKSPMIAKTYGSVPTVVFPSVSASSNKESQWLGKAVFWLLFISIIAPLMLTVCLICWFLVITIPMAKLNWALIKHMFERTDHIRFCSAPPVMLLPTRRSPPSSSTQVDGVASFEENDTSAPFFLTAKPPRLSEGQAAPSGSPSSTVLLCTYRAVGFQYYKYTVGGVNIFFVNLMAVVIFAILDAFILLPITEKRHGNGQHVPAVLAFIASRASIFILSLASVIPLSYFIGMAVASISAQSSIGMGAVINATFGSIIEIILYAIALTQGKGHLVEGSIMGSLLAGVLLMPGASMCSAALKKKEQKFNAKSAGVTSTMLIMAIIGTMSPTLFYQTYGNFQLVCEGCPPSDNGTSTLTSPWVCDHCYYEHPDPIYDSFYQSTVRRFSYFCAVVLLLSYLIGLWFSLRTHASQIWQNPQQLMHPLDISMPSGQGRLSLYHRLTQAGVLNTLPTHRLDQKGSTVSNNGSRGPSRAETPVPREPPTPTGTTHGGQHQQGSSFPGVQTPSPSLHRRVSYAPPPLFESVSHGIKTATPQAMQFPGNLTNDDFTRAVAVATVSALRHQQRHGQSPARLRGPDAHEDTDGGHDAPNWSRTTSASVLLGCTALYAVIAEILVDVVDVVLEGSGIDEKFLGVTLFALVPNTTEFMNAMSFAMYGNIALSMEIGSAYALQVCLLQIPAMVAFSAWYAPDRMGDVANTFTLIFPRWDVIAVILAIFLLTYTYIEAKSNYHRGSILVLSYVVLLAGFYYAPSRPDNVDMGFFNSSAQVFSTKIKSVLGLLQAK